MNGRNSKTQFQAFVEFGNANSRSTSVFDAVGFFIFCLNSRETEETLEFDFKQAVGYVDRIEKSVVFNYITIKEIEDAIYLLKNKGSNGDVGINNKTLAACKFCKSLQLFQPMR